MLPVRTKPVPAVMPLAALLTAIRQKTINPRPEYVVEVTGKTACQA